MSVDLKLQLGAVNFTDFIRVSAIKVSDPLQNEVYITYIGTPVPTNYELLIPNLDPANYLIRFRDAPDEDSLGTLVSEAFYNALTGEFEWERRYYTIGSLAEGITNTSTELIDPYLATKNVVGVFKEGFRYLIPGSEFIFTQEESKVALQGLHELSEDEVFILELRYAVGSSSTTIASGIFTDTILVTDAAYSISSSDKFKRHCLNCLGTKQVITMPVLSSIAIGDFFYIEHRRDGVQAQSKVVLSGIDKIYFNGLNLISGPLLTELWVAKGQSLYLRKDVIGIDSYYEVIIGYEGQLVGERMSSTLKTMPNWLPEDGRLLDGDEYPALYWWIRNTLPMANYIIDDTVSNPSYSHPAGKVGQFVIHSSGKAFRLPNTQNIYERGLKNFETYGGDVANRPIDYPGGKQDGAIKAHGHRIRNGNGGSSTNPLDAPTSGFSGTDNLGSFIGSSTTTSTWLEASGGTENLTDNIGVIYMRHI